MIIYDHESNAIIEESLKIKGASEQLAANTKMHTHLKKGINPKTHIMDKEFPKTVKKYLHINKFYRVHNWPFFDFCDGTQFLCWTKSRVLSTVSTPGRWYVQNHNLRPKNVIRSDS